MTAPIRPPDLRPKVDLFEHHDPSAVPLEVRRKRVRSKLHAMLAEARAAQRMPWPAKEARVNGIVFHNMANWLEKEEREALRAAFRTELERLATA